MRTADLVDAALELPIAPSFTRIGPAVRSRLDRWTPLEAYDLTGRVVVLTGPTSGLGLASARMLAERGATLVLVGRDRSRTEDVRARLAAPRLAGDHDVVVADLASAEAVRAAAEQIVRRHPRIDALIHNAGALSGERATSPEGIEATVASQVVGPFLLTSLLLDPLRAAQPGRVLTMSSGGMYAAGLTVDNLEMHAGEYGGAEQYARAKRAQVTLTQMWAERVPPEEVVFHSLHPGWADTPGVRSSLPTFHRLTAPFLRTPDQGADSLVWLVADEAPAHSTGQFWHDRRVRPLHRLPSTRRSDTHARREELWQWVAARAGVDPAA